MKSAIALVTSSLLLFAVGCVPTVGDESEDDGGNTGGEVETPETPGTPLPPGPPATPPGEPPPGPEQPPPDDPGPTDPPHPDDPEMGFFRIGGGAYFANGQGAYCAINGLRQLGRCTGSEDFTALREEGTIGSLEYQGRCECGVDPTIGFFRVGAAGHYANGLGAFCTLGSIDQLRRCTGNPDFNALREEVDTGALADQGQCQCGLGPDPGFFRIGSGAYFANDQHAYCAIVGMAQFTRCTGSTNFFSVREEPSTGFLTNQGRCGCGVNPTPGFFRIGGGAYFANSIGAYCAIGSNEQLARCTGGAAFTSLPEEIDAGNLQYQGQCGC